MPKDTLKRRNLLDITDFGKNSLVFSESLAPDKEGGFKTDFTGIEVFDSSKLLILHKLLSDKAHLHPLGSDVNIEDILFKTEEQPLENRVNIALHQINRILNPSKEEVMRIQRGTMYTMKRYGFNNDFGIGRLQAQSPSIQKISRQLRYFLFKDTYMDVDLVNAHPSMLSLFASSNNISAPHLKDYVDNREEVLEKIMKEENIPRSKAKLAILIVTYGGNSGCEGEIISNLSKDLLLLRESLWGLLYNEENSLGLFFSQKHQLSFKPPYKKGLSHYKLGKLKSSFQAIYCQNEETKCLRLLRETFLKESGFSPEPNIHSEKPFLSFVPFYDGAYIGVFDIRKGPTAFRRDLEELLPGCLDHVNSIIHPLAFDLKDIEPNWSFLSEESLRDYTSLYQTLRGVNFRAFRAIQSTVDNPVGISDRVWDTSFDVLKRSMVESKKQGKENKNFKNDVFSLEPLRSTVLLENRRFAYHFRLSALRLLKNGRLEEIIRESKEKD